MEQRENSEGRAELGPTSSASTSALRGYGGQVADFPPSLLRGCGGASCRDRRRVVEDAQ